MKSNPTLKDISSHLDLSLRTVHKAIYNKRGVSAKTRSRVLDYVEKIGYRINPTASALKRRTIRLVAVLINREGDNYYFYPSITAGVRIAADKLSIMNIEVEYIFISLDHKEQAAVLDDILARNVPPDGLLTTVVDAKEIAPRIDEFSRRGIPVVTVSTDAPSSLRTGCVNSDANTAGTLAGDMLENLCRDRPGRFLIIGGKRELANHQENVLAFINSVRQANPSRDLIELYDFEDVARLKHNLKNYVSRLDDIVGIYCNNARNTMHMCQALSGLAMRRAPFTVGSDAYDELSPHFASGLLTACIVQYPEEQGEQGLLTLYEQAVAHPESPTIRKIRVGIVLKSNFRQYIPSREPQA